MAKFKRRKLPQYLHFIDGRYAVRVPIKPELRPYLGGKFQFYQALGPDLRSAKENSHYHIAVFKEQLREAAEEYARDTGKQVTIISEPVDPTKLMVRQYQKIVAWDQDMRDATHRYSTSAPFDEAFVASLRDGIAGRLSDDQYFSLIAMSLEELKVRFAPNARPGAKAFAS